MIWLLLLEQHDGWRAASLSNRVGAKPPIEAVPPQQALMGMVANSYAADLPL